MTSGTGLAKEHPTSIGENSPGAGRLYKLEGPQPRRPQQKKTKRANPNQSIGYRTSKPLRNNEEGRGLPRRSHRKPGKTDTVYFIHGCVLNDISDMLRITKTY